MPKTVNLINSVSENGTLVFVDTLVIKKKTSTCCCDLHPFI